MCHHQTRSMPGACKAGGKRGMMGAVNKVMMGTAGTVDLHAISTTGYEERQQWGGREGASAEVFD